MLAREQRASHEASTVKRILTWFHNLFFPPGHWPLWMRLSPFVLSGGLFLVVLFLSVNAWEYTNSPEFCGTGCHTMPPEYAAYQASPHAEVKCVECHIGREFVGNQFARKLGDVRHVAAMISKSYEYPIEIKSMRPATEICERCHSPEKFSDDSQRIVVSYQPDLENTRYVTYLNMRTGGGTVRQGLGKGIHWHIQNQVYYYATDGDDQQVPYVKVVNPEDGSTSEYVDVRSGFDPYQVQEEDLKRMDCITCHNRISHAIPQPEEAVDTALFRQRIPASIPEIRLKAVEALHASYNSNEEAMNGIARLSDFYRETYPDFYDGNSGAISQAVSVLQEIYAQSVFPDQKVNWDTHRNNLSHTGCFRCHDGNHLDISGRAIRLECNLCHAIPVTAGPGDEIVNLAVDNRHRPQSHASPSWIALHEYVYDENDENETCSSCHEGAANYAAADDASFCANSACHGSGAVQVNLDGFETLSIFPKVVLSLPHYPASLPPVAEWNSPPSLDEIHREQEEMECKDCHDPFPPEAPPGNEICISCHGETLPGAQALTAKYDPNPHDWHYGQDLSCYICHNNFGPEKNPCALCHEDKPLKLKDGSGN